MPDHVYIIAEIGINHNGAFDNCRRMIDAAADAGCDAAKFQLFTARHLYPRSAGTLDWKDAAGEYSYNIYEAAERFELPEAWIDGLMAHCAARKLDFLSSVSDEFGLRLIVDRGVKRIKLTSYTLTNIPLIEHCARTGLPLILSTGGSTISEVDDALSAVKKFHDDVAVLHCSIRYPTALQDCNLGVLDTFRYAFPGVTIGYSDHTTEVSDAPVQAVRLGARIIEKHFTLDKSMTGPDHFFALEPSELSRMVRDIRQTEADGADRNIDPVLYGNTARIPYPQEVYLREFAFTCLFAARPVRQGERISPADIAILRPGKKPRGLEPKYLRLFSDNRITAKKDIALEDPITWEAILNEKNPLPG